MLIVGLITVVMAALVGWGRSLIFIPMAKGEDDRRYRDGTRQQKQLARWEPKMRPAIVAFAFGVLIFFASSAALALEPPLEGPGHLSLLMLATLAALTGLISIAGAAPFRERRWGAILGCATASVTASVVAVIVAMHLAGKFPLHVSPSGAALILAIARFAGAALLVQQAYMAFGVTSAKKTRDE